MAIKNAITLSKLMLLSFNGNIANWKTKNTLFELFLLFYKLNFYSLASMRPRLFDLSVAKVMDKRNFCIKERVTESYSHAFGVAINETLFDTFYSHAKGHASEGGVNKTFAPECFYSLSIKSLRRMFLFVGHGHFDANGLSLRFRSFQFFRQTISGTQQVFNSAPESPELHDQ